jgi:hypothetical protein
LASSRRSALAAALILLPLPLPAQSRGAGPLVVAGHLVKVAARDTTPLAGVWVVLHRVGPVRQGPVDSMRTDAAGGYRFAVGATDTSDVFVVSSLFQGVGYFADPVPARGPRLASLDLAVFEASASGPPLTVGIRSVVVTRLGGTRKVLDIYQVVNGGTATRIGRDSAAPTFTTRLAAGAVQPAAGESDVPASAIRFAGGTAQVFAPFPPGEKQVVVSFILPEGQQRLDIPLDQPTGRLELLLEDSTARVGPGLTATEPMELEGHRFRRFEADSVAAGSTFTVRFGAAGMPTSSPRAIALGAALALALGAAWALRRRRAGAPAAAPAVLADEEPSAERLVAMLAALDERFAGREAETPPAEWNAYRSRRGALKAALSRRLARG